MRARDLAVVAAAMTLAGMAPAQLPGPVNPSTMDIPAGAAENRNIDLERDYRRLRDDVFQRKPGPTSSSSPIPASPQDVIQGSEVRDKRGLLVGTIERVGTDFAVVSGPAGRVEVDFKSFAKNRMGLLINLRKAQLDAMMSGAPK